MSGNGWKDAVLEQLEGGVSQAQQQAKKAPTNIANSVISQITGKSPNDSGSHEAGQTNAPILNHQSLADAQAANDDVVRELYAPSKEQRAESGEQNAEEKEQTDSQKAASKFIQEKIDDGMSPEEAQKLYSLRKQLHNEYYQRLINYGKNQPEERTAEKVEKEKEEDDRMNLEEQKKKDTPIAVQMGANRAEKFPGASG